MRQLLIRSLQHNTRHWSAYERERTRCNAQQAGTGWLFFMLVLSFLIRK